MPSIVHYYLSFLMSTPSTCVRYWVDDQRHPRTVYFKSFRHAHDFIESFIKVGWRAEVQPY